MTIEAIDDPVQLRLRVAARIAAEVRHGPRLAKVTSMLHAFRTPGRQLPISDVKSCLHKHGVRYSSGWDSVRQTGVLTLSLADDAQRPLAQPDGDETIQLSVWSPGRVPGDEVPLSPFRPPDPADVLWFKSNRPCLRSQTARAALPPRSSRSAAGGWPMTSSSGVRA